MWATEGATGTGALLAQQLAAAGEQVLDVPPTLSARVRLLDSGRTDKTDSHDARSAAVVALRHQALRPIRVQDHVATLRLLAKRHHDLVAARTRAVCRLHTTLCHLAEGHFPKRMRAAQAAAILARARPTDPVVVPMGVFNGRSDRSRQWTVRPLVRTTDRAVSDLYDRSC